MYTIGNEEVLISCWGMDPLRLFCEMSKIANVGSLLDLEVWFL